MRDNDKILQPLFKIYTYNYFFFSVRILTACNPVMLCAGCGGAFQCPDI